MTVITCPTLSLTRRIPQIHLQPKREIAPHILPKRFAGREVLARDRAAEASAKHHAAAGTPGSYVMHLPRLHVAMHYIHTKLGLKMISYEALQCPRWAHVL